MVKGGEAKGGEVKDGEAKDGEAKGGERMWRGGQMLATLLGKIHLAHSASLPG